MILADDIVQEVISANGSTEVLLRFVCLKAEEVNHHYLHEARRELLEARARLKKATQHIMHYAQYPCRNDDELSLAEAAH